MESQSPSPSSRSLLDPPSFLQKKVIVIAGPTAVGKSFLSLKLAKMLRGEIISADSVQVYRGMDIGTAKLSMEERRLIPHHLIDIRELSQDFDVMQFYHCAIQAIEHIMLNGHVPIVVGGTGFYLHTLLHGIPQGPPPSTSIREQIDEDMETHGVEAMYHRLCALDPQYGAGVSRRDRQKITRGLEIMALTKKKVSSFPQNQHRGARNLFFLCWFFYLPRTRLYSRIEMRCDQMIAKGLIQEVERLEREGLRENTSASRAIGYRQGLHFLSSERNNQDWETFVWEMKKASRQLAKRQFTWFRKESNFRWVNLEEVGYSHAIMKVLQEYYRC